MNFLPALLKEREYLRRKTHPKNSTLLAKKQQRTLAKHKEIQNDLELKKDVHTKLREESIASTALLQETLKHLYQKEKEMDQLIADKTEQLESLSAKSRIKLENLQLRIRAQADG